jgi:hypothetical protein
VLHDQLSIAKVLRSIPLSYYGHLRNPQVWRTNLALGIRKKREAEATDDPGVVHIGVWPYAFLDDTDRRARWPGVGGRFFRAGPIDPAVHRREGSGVAVYSTGLSEPSLSVQRPADNNRSVQIRHNSDFQKALSFSNKGKVPAK